mmetsp:Transcript_18452/g.49621  ORF Transcript_18452/g.49621 Transcript_18452/m.49621 type:complete len:236 (+) Transcript_18452:272-979(+)
MPTAAPPGPLHCRRTTRCYTCSGTRTASHRAGAPCATETAARSSSDPPWSLASRCGTFATPATFIPKQTSSQRQPQCPRELGLCASLARSTAARPCSCASSAPSTRASRRAPGLSSPCTCSRSRSCGAAQSCVASTSTPCLRCSTRHAPWSTSSTASSRKRCSRPQDTGSCGSRAWTRPCSRRLGDTPRVRSEKILSSTARTCIPAARSSSSKPLLSRRPLTQTAREVLSAISQS